MDGTTFDHVYLVSSSYHGRSGYYEHFYLYPESISILSGFDASNPKPVDCIIVPCANAHGFRSGLPPEVQPYV